MLDVTRPPGTRDRRPARTGLQGRRASTLLCAVPLLVVAVVGWRRRWMSDDGLINVRVIDNLFAGHGPVFNVGERVEVGTSTAWLAVLALGHAVTPWLEVARLAVWTGLLCTLLGLAAATAGAVLLGRLLGDRGIVVPLGTLVLAALPPFWDFATSGLETGLTFLWLGASFLLLVRRLGRLRVGGAGIPLPGAWRPVLPAVVIGAGPLVRPDLTLIAAVLGLALLAQSRRDVRGVLGAAAAALALPVGYEVLRAGYYATLVPNTALAKGAGQSAYDSGLRYLADFAVLYVLGLPLLGVGLVLAVPAVRRAWSSRDVAVSALLLAPVAGALLHGAFVVRVGGDFMHGRFLLPATFCLLMPWAAVAVGEGWTRVRVGAALAVVVVWATAVGTSIRVPYANSVGAGGIADERGFYVDVIALNRTENPTSVTDFASGAVGGFYDYAEDARDRVAQGQRVFVVDGAATPAADGYGVVVRFGNIGIFGVRAGPGVFVADRGSLASAIGARLVLPPQSDGRIGHSQIVPLEWDLARYAAPAPTDTPDVLAAREALACGDLRVLDEAITAPMTPGRFARNVGLSLGLTRLKVPADPQQARDRFCAADAAPPAS